MTGDSRRAVGYTGRDYGTHQRQQQEWLERCGLAHCPYVDGFEDDNQADMDAERGDGRHTMNGGVV